MPQAELACTPAPVLFSIRWRSQRSPFATGPKAYCGCEVCPVQYPGREHRSTELPFSQFSHSSRPWPKGFLPLLTNFWRYSAIGLGALVSFELARRLRTSYSVSPIRLLSRQSCRSNSSSASSRSPLCRKPRIRSGTCDV